MRGKPLLSSHPSSRLPFPALSSFSLSAVCPVRSQDRFQPTDTLGSTLFQLRLCGPPAEHSGHGLNALKQTGGSSLCTVRLPVLLPEKTGQRHLIALRQKHHRTQGGISPRPARMRRGCWWRPRSAPLPPPASSCAVPEATVAARQNHAGELPPACHPDVPPSTSLCTFPCLSGMAKHPFQQQDTEFWFPCQLVKA